MASIINAATSGGLVTSADTSGILQLQTASITAVTVDASQRLGIGTTSPAQKLHLNVASGNIYNQISSGSNNVYIGYQSSGAISVIESNNALAFNVGSSYTERMRIDTSGNLLIGGTTAPTSSTVKQVIQTASGGFTQYGVSGGTGGMLGAGGENLLFYTYTGSLGSETYTERARIVPFGIQSTNSISVGSATPSTSGAGITFPATQSASSNANTLDDYEEGTWTPSFTLDSGSATASSNTGSYVKIGKQVTITLTITFSVPSAANVNDITGLPFTVSSLSQRGVGVVRENANTGFAWLLRTNPNVTTANLRRYDNAQALTDGMQFLGSVTYFTD